MLIRSTYVAHDTLGITSERVRRVRRKQKEKERRRQRRQRVGGNLLWGSCSRLACCCLFVVSTSPLMRLKGDRRPQTAVPTLRERGNGGRLLLLRGTWRWRSYTEELS